MVADYTHHPGGGSLWLRGLRLYVPVLAGAHLVWEILQLPLYTVYQSPLRTQAWAVIHCTLGDLVIGTSALVAALLIAGDRAWPLRRFYSVAALTLAFGLAYTAYSEWLNVAVRGAWTYSAGMPTLALFGFALGLAPMLQWVIVPALAHAIVRLAVTGGAASRAPEPPL